MSNIITESINNIKFNLPSNVTLVAVSKTKPNEAILDAYEGGQRIFGENKVQELTRKQEELPKDIEWHMIGHLQSNKVKYIAPFVHLIHAVDSLKLLKEINKQAHKNNRIINVLLQVKIAEEESKFGLSQSEANEILKVQNEYSNVKIVGLMGMATNSDNEVKVREEFKNLHSLYNQLSSTFPQLTTLSMGMTGDYKIAIEEGSTMVRIGSAIFGERNYN